MCVYVDADWGKKNKDLSSKYGVGGYPHTVFTDPEGKEVGNVGGFAPTENFLPEVEKAAKTKKAAAFLESWEEAQTAGKDEEKPVAILFSNGKADAEALEAAIGDDLLKDLREKFVWCKFKLDAKSDVCKQFKVASSSQSVLMVVDPKAEKPEEKPIKKWSGKRTAKELKKELEGVLKTLEHGK